MRLLSDFVMDAENYTDAEAQSDGAEDEFQTLAAFMEDNSTDPSAPGLSNYQSPVPIVPISRNVAAESASQRGRPR